MSDEDLFIVLSVAAVCGGHGYRAIEVARAVLEKLKNELKAREKCGMK